MACMHAHHACKPLLLKQKLIDIWVRQQSNQRVLEKWSGQSPDLNKMKS